MTDEQRDALLLGLRDDVRRIEGKVDAVSDQLQDVARAVREIGGDVPDERPHETTSGPVTRRRLHDRFRGT